MSKVLFSISVDNHLYTTSNIINAIKQLPEETSEIQFFIADNLQLYNKAKLADNGIAYRDILTNFRVKNNYFSERQKWLAKIKTKHEEPQFKINWHYTSVNDYNDEIFFGIYRSLLIFFHLNLKFKSDIETASVEYLNKNNKKWDLIDLNLSCLYILEEIALNIRVRVTDNIKDEYYLGDFPDPLPKLYDNRYDIDIETLTNKSIETKFNFFEIYFEFGKMSWRKFKYPPSV